MPTPSQARLTCTVEIFGNGSPTGATRHTFNGAEIRNISSLAIATSGDVEYNLLYLDAEGKELTDTCHGTIEAAKSQAKLKFNITDERWQCAR